MSTTNGQDNNATDGLGESWLAPGNFDGAKAHLESLGRVIYFATYAGRIPHESIYVSFFPDESAQDIVVDRLTLLEIRGLILGTPHKEKSGLPFLKLAKFGTERSDRNCIRWDKNVFSIFGVELDYDGKQMSYDVGRAILEKAKIRGLIYTSATHKAEAPKWRVLCPTSRELEPGERYKLAARLNGLYGGIFAPESFTLSQAFYFGKVGDAPEHRADVIDGHDFTYVDERDDLDAGAIGRSKGNDVKSAGADNVFLRFGAEHSSGAPIDIEELLANLVWNGSGVGGGNGHLTMLSCTAAWLNRGDSIDEAVEKGLAALADAAEKSGGKIDHDAEKAVLCRMCEDWIRKNPKLAEDKTGAEGQTNTEAKAKTAPLPFIDMSRWDDEPAPPREWAVMDRIPLRQVTLFSGEGSVGKSIVQLMLTDAHVLGRDWLGTTPTPGPALFIDAEDDINEMRRRSENIVRRYYDSSFAEAIKGGLHLMSLAGKDALLATANGSKIVPTPLYKQLLEWAGDIKPKMIGIASSANVFAGNEIDRAHVQQFIGLLTRMAIAANGGLVLISHPSLTGINTDTGLSGTTAWHNSVRARMYMKGVKAEKGQQIDSDLRELVFKKNNYGPISESIVLRYENGLFLPVPGVSSLDQAARDDMAEEVFLTLLRRFTDQNRFVSDHRGTNYAPALFAKEFEAALVGREALAHAMVRLFHKNRIHNEERPGRKDRVSYRLAVGPAPVGL
jgi:RecA-family ATPase